MNRNLSRQNEENSPNILDDVHHESIEELLDIFNPNQLNAEESILNYWDSLKETDPTLHKLAMVVFAIPPTEVSIERDFSKLKYVFSDRRCQIQAERLEDIMPININPEVFYLIKQDEIYTCTKKSNTK